jgi:hypothetical protein
VDLLRKGFRDIARGYSSGFVLSRPVTIKHLSHADHIDQETKREEFYEFARKQGALTIEERTAQMLKLGLWTDEKERKLKEHVEMVVRMTEAKKANAKMPSMVRDYVKKIEEEQKLLDALQHEKHQLLGLTSDAYADRETADHYILTNIFTDPQMREPCFTQDELDNMEEREVGQIIADYNAAIEPCSELNIKRIAMQPFFQNYFSLVGDNLRDFFGKPICALTFFQVTMLRSGVRFRDIYCNHNTGVWPKDVLADPDLFLDYAAAVDRGKQDAQAKGAYNDGTINVGVKAEDAKALGLRANNALASELVAKSGAGSAGVSLIDHMIGRK